MNKILPMAASLLILVGLVYFSGPSQLYSIISGMDKTILVFGLSLWFLSSLIRTFRWRWLLNEINLYVPFTKTYKVFNAGLFLSIITPGKVGDPARCALLKKETGKSFSKSLPTIVVERIFDISIMLALGIIGFMNAPVKGVQNYLITAGIVYTVVIGSLVFMLSSKDRMYKMLMFFINLLSFIPKIKNVGKEVPYFAENFHASFRQFKKMSPLAVTMVLTLFIWLIEGVIFYLAFQSIGIQVGYMIVVTALMISTLVSVLTFLPGGLGSSEVVMVLFFGSLLGIGIAEVTSAALIGRLMSFWVTAFVGSVFLANINSQK